jgi:hypothetical protein
MLVWLVAVVIASFLCTAGLKLAYRSPTVPYSPLQSPTVPYSLHTAGIRFGYKWVAVDHLRQSFQ